MATEPTSTAASAVIAGGVVTTPVLAGLGIDMTTIGAALIGVVVVQTLLPASKLDWRVLFGISIGSMLFSSLGTPWAELWARDAVPYFKDLREWHAHAITAAVLGGFAQPILLVLRAFLLRGRDAVGRTPEPKGDQP